MILLDSPFIYEEFYSAGNLWRYTLANGEYKAMYEDASGTYFAGPGNCLKMEFIATQEERLKSGIGNTMSNRCGIYVANKAEVDPKIYFYKHSMTEMAAANEAVVSTIVNSTATPVQAGVGGGVAMGIISALDEAESKNIHIFYNQPKSNTLRLAIRRQ